MSAKKRKKEEEEPLEEKIEEKAKETEGTEETEVVEETKEIAEEAEEKKPTPEKKAEAEEDIVEERIYTVPLGKAWIAPRKGRSPKATRMLKSFVEKHMKIDSDSIVVTNEVNRRIWSRGIEKPPRKIRIRAAKDKEGIVTVHVAEED